MSTASPKKVLSDLGKSVKRTVLRGINSLRVASAVIEGETITIGALVFQAKVNAAYALGAGNILIDLSGSASAAASTVLTSNNTNVTDGDTATLGAVTYRFKTVMAAINDVQIGASADATLLSLAKTINGTGVAGTDMFAGTVIHPTVSSSATVTTHTITITAKLKGTGGNAIASKKVSATLSFTGATLANGTDPTAAEYTTALTTAVNAQATIGFTATRISANEVLFGNIANVIPDVIGNAQATGVLTSSANYASTETFTIDTTIYTFVTALSGKVNEILIGSTEAITIANAVAAINATTTAGITFALAQKPNPKVTAVGGTHTITVTAIRAGAAQNAVATTETAANAAWGSATLTGGTDTAYFSKTLSGANNAWASTTWYGFVPPPTFVESFSMSSRSPNAQEIATKSIHFLFGFTVRCADFQLRDSTGLAKAFDGTLTFSANRVTLSASTGVNMATNDLVTITASE